MKPGTVKLGGAIPHITQAAGKNLKCRCGQPATRFVLCRTCKHIVCTCMNHAKTIDEEASEHCGA